MGKENAKKSPLFYLSCYNGYVKNMYYAVERMFVQVWKGFQHNSKVVMIVRVYAREPER